jgi:hypothetical protein
VQSRYQAECIIRRWEDSRLTPPECYDPPMDDDEIWNRADDEAEERFCERLMNNGRDC